MKIKVLAVTLGLIAGSTLSLLGADPAPAPSAPAAEAAPSETIAQLQALVAKVQAKLKNGEDTEAALAPELKEFDALLAAHKGEKTEDVSQILVMKALLYVQVFQNVDEGEKLFLQLQKEYPETDNGKNAAQALTAIAAQKESMKLQSALKPGAAFPDFSETDTAGKPLSISGYKGKVVLVDFWATWCGPCVAELPNVIAAYQKYHDKGFEIVGISLDKNKGELEKFVKEKGMTWQQYFDGQGWESKLGRQYGINSIPATYLLDAEGKIIATNLRGPALEQELAKRLTK